MALRKRIDPIAQFMQEHDETLVQLSSLNKASRALVDHGFNEEVYFRLLRAVEFIDQEVGVHNKREEEALFPVLERYVEGPTRLMRDDHKELAKEFRRLRRAVNRLKKNKASAAAARDLQIVAKGIVQRMVNHIHKENYILFPLVQKFLTKDALREVARRMI